MPICIECCYPVSQLYHVLHSRNHKVAPPPISKPTHQKSGSNLPSPQKPIPNVPNVPETKAKPTNTGGVGDVRLTQCPRCKRFADKYVEHDFVVLFIDLVLVKPQVSYVGLQKKLVSRKRQACCWQLLRELKANAPAGLQTPSLQSPLS